MNVTMRDLTASSTPALTALLLAAALASSAAAQVLLDEHQRLAFDRPESWAMKYFTAATTPTGFGVPRAVEPGALLVGLEGGWLPSLSEEERRVGFNGAKVEDINRSSVFARPRLLIGLPASLSLELGYVPPVELDGVEPNLISLALGRPVYESGRWRAGVRLTAQHGTLEGDITCPAAEAAAGRDPSRNPLNCLEPSNDELTSTAYGLELSAAIMPARSKFEPYATLAVNRMDLELQLDARWSVFVDRTLQTTDGTTWHATAGFQYEGWERSSLGVELFYSPLDVVRPPATGSRNDALFNVRTLFRYKIR